MFEKISGIESPEYFKQKIALPERLRAIKQERDQQLRRILAGEEERFLLIIGPCSADHADAVCEYVGKLARVQEQVAGQLLLLPRIYTNKPRTNGKGYKGISHQPDPAGEPDIPLGIVATRELHLRAMQESHLTAADEMLYPENLVYVDDLVSYHAIGARSVENQQHRLTASALDAPVGMKNPTSGDLSIMFNAMVAAQSSHTFLYRQDAVKTSGNPYAHAILRGYVDHYGKAGQNYHYEHLLDCATEYERYDLAHPAVIVDLNHANSNKQYGDQPRIAREILLSRSYHPKIKGMVKGMMIESYLESGSQPVSGGVYGKSITDPCLGWAESERLIYEIADQLAR